MPIEIRHFTDPGCPFAYSAEPIRRRLQVLYPDATWSTTMIGLTEKAEDYEAKGLTLEFIAQNSTRLAREHGMPIAGVQKPRHQATWPACALVVAARRVDPALGDRVLRRLRVLGFDGGLIDDPGLQARAVAEAGGDASLIDAAKESDVLAEFAEDRRAARDPVPAARVLDHKLAGPDDERRYTCPSLEITGPAGTQCIPGFWGVEPYEVAFANADPSISRAEVPESALDVLARFDEPLATQEVATVLGIDRETARARLTIEGARFEPVASDGFWTMG